MTKLVKIVANVLCICVISIVVLVIAYFVGVWWHMRGNLDSQQIVYISNDICLGFISNDGSGDYVTIFSYRCKSDEEQIIDRTEAKAVCPYVVKESSTALRVKDDRSIWNFSCDDHGFALVADQIVRISSDGSLTSN